MTAKQKCQPALVTSASSRRTVGGRSLWASAQRSLHLEWFSRCGLLPWGSLCCSPQSSASSSSTTEEFTPTSRPYGGAGPPPGGSMRGTGTTHPPPLLPPPALPALTGAVAAPPVPAGGTPGDRPGDAPRHN